MRSLALASAFAAASLVQAGPTPTEPELPRRANALPTVTVSGNAFWAGSTRFYVRGIDYQPGGSSAMSDPLADKAICTRDIAKFKELGINTIRVYITDNSKSHDDCMNALADAGIYVILDANNPNYSINRDNPGPSYNAKYLQSVFATIDAFIKFPNTLAFFSGNEVVNDTASSSNSAPFVKATTRDMRQYIAARGPRKVPVGYSAADVATNRMQLAAYMNCGTDEERSDFFAFNDYSWCKSDFKTSGWDQKVKNFTGYGLPIFLSEWGCITKGRDFGELSALMSSQMSGVYSGGLLYEYALEPNEYGIVQISGSQVSELPDFARYKSALAANPAPTGNGGATAAAAAKACPTKDSQWLVDGAQQLPALPDEAKQYMSSGAGTGPGLQGGSQNAGGSGTGSAPPGSGTGTKNEGASFLGPMDLRPVYVSGIVVFMTLVGAAML